MDEIILREIYHSVVRNYLFGLERKNDPQTIRTNKDALKEKAKSWGVDIPEEAFNSVKWY